VKQIVIAQVANQIKREIIRTKDTILKELKIKQKPQLDQKIGEITPKVFRQTIKFITRTGASIGAHGFTRKIGQKIGKLLRI
jgi:hypothetical protein